MSQGLRWVSLIVAGVAMLVAATGCIVIATMTSVTRDELLITTGVSLGATFGFVVLAVVFGVDRLLHGRRGGASECGATKGDHRDGQT